MGGRKPYFDLCLPARHEVSLSHSVSVWYHNFAGLVERQQLNESGQEAVSREARKVAKSFELEYVSDRYLKDFAHLLA